MEVVLDYSTICKFRNAIGCKQMSNIFEEVKRQMQKRNCCAEVFTFVDATALISKLAMWEERDKAILADKGYVGAIGEIKAQQLQPMVILRNNMKIKNKDLDQ